MGDKEKYKCGRCGKIVSDEHDEVPECCGVQMEKLPYCTTTDTAEHARTNDDGEPCDDGRAG